MSPLKQLNIIQRTMSSSNMGSVSLPPHPYPPVSVVHTAIPLSPMPCPANSWLWKLGKSEPMSPLHTWCPYRCVPVHPLRERMKRSVLGTPSASRPSAKRRIHDTRHPSPIS
jgi:hypothetical protein